jgi:2-polyprenyl-3-methyl-5-hydroxy-6-metoxy-1,4-benzoquinol methylase
MEQRHKYEYNVDLDSDHVGVKIFRMVGREKRVLEIGAGPGSITRLLKEHGQCRVTAIELDSQAIEKLGAFCERVYQCDLNAKDWTTSVSADGKFQVVVAADVLEHLYDPWSTLRAMRSVLSDDGYIVVSLPHIGHQAVLASLALGDFDYHDWGLLDRTHIRFFGIKSMQRLFDEAGLKIIEAEFLVRAPEHTEFANEWARAPAELKRNLAKCRFGSIYQVVIKAVPQSAPGRGLTLVSLPVPTPGPLLPPDASFGSKLRMTLKLLARRFMSQRTRAHLSEWLIRIGLRL